MKVESDFEHGQQCCTGILLTNLGSPDAPTASAVRRYLSEFLWDPRVVELPRSLWWLILHGIILRIRPAISARRYRLIWTERGSPLLVIAQRQAAALAGRLAAECSGPVKLVVGMRYGIPSIASALRELRRAGAQRLLILPLYPQYSAATTASAFDAVAKEFKSWRWLPELRMVRHYHDDLGYIAALCQKILAAWGQEAAGERLLFSFHGLPERSLLAGDPYHCECHKTARLVAEQLGLEAGRWTVAFQSRFGGAEWLKPYTSEVLKEWARSGIKSVDVVCPGFSADCLETLEEIAVENRELFIKTGGKRYRYIPALNESPEHIGCLVDLIRKHTLGWLEFSPDFSAAAGLAAGELSRARALAMGVER
jgi:ferrochelatase